MSAYLAGLATLPALAAIGWVAIHALFRMADIADHFGWFAETGKPPGSHVKWSSVVAVRDYGPVHVGLYRHLDGGSRWVALGPIITVGRRSEGLAITRKELDALREEEEST